MAGGLLLLIFWNLDQIEFWNLHDAILDQQSPALFNPKVPKRCGGGGGGGGILPIGQEMACHFSQDHAMVIKILDFIHKHLN